MKKFRLIITYHFTSKLFVGFFNYWFLEPDKVIFSGKYTVDFTFIYSYLFTSEIYTNKIFTLVRLTFVGDCSVANWSSLIGYSPVHLLFYSLFIGFIILLKRLYSKWRQQKN